MKTTPSPRSGRARPSLAALALLLVAPAVAADAIVDGSRSVCTHPDAALPRVVQVIYDDPDSPIPCRVLYEKDGAVKEIAAARNSTGHCEKTERKVVRNLAAGGYDCKHTFMGALASADRSVTLDLFTDGTDAFAVEPGDGAGGNALGIEDDAAGTVGTSSASETSSSGDTSVSGGVSGSDGLSSTDGASDPGGADTLADGTSHEHTYTHSHPLGDDGVAVLHTHTTVTVDVTVPIADAGASAEEADARTLADADADAGAKDDEADDDAGAGADAGAGSSASTSASANADASTGTAVEPIAGSSTDTDGGASAARLAGTADRRDTGTSTGMSARLGILSRPLARESEAHRFAAEFRRNFPKVETRVARHAAGAGGGTWHVALGVGDDEAALERALLTLGEDARALFEITPLEPAATGTDDPLVFARDDWARYAIASCYADGRRTAEEFADCASVVVDADAFVECLGGGLCAPARAGEDTDVTLIDLAAVLAADDPVAAARQRVIDRVEGCERADAGDDAAFAECAALAVLDDDHRAVYDCYERSASDLALLECAGGERVADYARAYDRCGASGYEAATCLLEQSDNDYLESAAYCLAYEDAAEIATCGLDANLSDDDALILACLTDYTERAERAVCLARERLDDTEYAAVQCATYAESVTDYGLCVGERGGALSAETLHAARCLEGQTLAPDTLLDCAGGQFVNEDIRGCLEYGIGDPRCFDTETLISRVAEDAVDDYLQLASLENEIARFRQELYALEGGDLAEVLASEGGAAGMKAIEETTKKATGGLRGLFGLKPR